MLRVTKVEGWLPRSHDAGPGRQDLRSSAACVIIRSGGCLPGAYPPAPVGGRPGDEAPGQAAATQDCRRSDGERPGGSGPSSGRPALRLHLVMIPPGTRGMPHLHGRETAGYVVSGEAEVWHGTGLIRRSVVRAGDFIYIPPGTPHLAVNRGDVTSIAVVARAGQQVSGQQASDQQARDQQASDQEVSDQDVNDQEDRAGSVVVELPRHLAGLLSYPVGYG
jgi:uncharacterized RmlC-like cupin family protein